MSDTADRSALVRPDTLLRLAIAAILLVMITAGIAYWGFDIDLLDGLSGLPGCPIQFVTGHECPGCGMTRAMVSLGQGKIAQAVRFNPIAPVLLAFMLFFLIRGRAPAIPHRDRYATAALIVICLFWFTRLL